MSVSSFEEGLSYDPDFHKLPEKLRSEILEHIRRVQSENYRLVQRLNGAEYELVKEPIAWLVQCKLSDLVEQAEPNEKACNPEYWTDAFPVYKRTSQ